MNLKGHETSTKLLMWYSENEPKPDQPGQPPNSTSLEARVTTHLETACTIAGLLGHAILTEPSVCPHFSPSIDAITLHCPGDRYCSELQDRRARTGSQGRYIWNGIGVVMAFHWGADRQLPSGVAQITPLSYSSTFLAFCQQVKL